MLDNINRFNPPQYTDKTLKESPKKLPDEAVQPDVVIDRKALPIEDLINGFKELIAQEPTAEQLEQYRSKFAALNGFKEPIANELTAEQYRKASS